MIRTKASTNHTIPEKTDFPTLPNGTKNYLQIDPPIAGQNWVCMSFISPEDMIEKRNMYYFNQFLYREINKTLKDQTVHMAKEVNLKLQSTFAKKLDKLKKSVNETDKLVYGHLEEICKQMQLDEDEFSNKCMHLYKIDYPEIQDKFTMFKVQNATEIDKQFDEQNKSTCSVRGFKVRGVYNERKEAEERCKLVREMAEPIDVFVAPVGYWCPWDPAPDAIQDSEYMVEDLNKLMGKYHEGVRQKNQFFAERKQEMVNNADRSNKERIRERLRKKAVEKEQLKRNDELKNARINAAIN